MDHCTRCNSDRVVSFYAKCEGTFHCESNGLEHDGRPPKGFALGKPSGFVQGTFCSNCGQIQGDFPAPVMDFERGEDD